MRAHEGQLRWTRRGLGPLLLAPWLRGAEAGSITDVGGIRVGQFTDTRRPTGCTVILFDTPAVASVDVRGSAPGTRETDLLDPVNTVQHAHGIVLAGGSAYGLDAATGVMRWLEEKGIGYPVGTSAGPGVVPIVPAAILNDLMVGDSRIRPNAEAGYAAAKAAKAGPLAEGNVGAGAGATVGKLFGPERAMKGGLGTASIRVAGSPVVVGAIVAVNALGDVVDPATGRLVAGARTESGKELVDSMEELRKGYRLDIPVAANTTIGLVATNAPLTKAQLKKVAQMAHDGLARTIRPVHTPADGDVVFAASTGSLRLAVNHGVIGALAADALAEAVLRAVRMAKGIAGYPAAGDLGR